MALDLTNPDGELDRDKVNARVRKLVDDLWDEEVNEDVFYRDIVNLIDQVVCEVQSRAWTDFMDIG